MSSSTKTRRSRDEAATSRPPAGTNRPAPNAGTQNVSFRFPIELVEKVDAICQANHWTRGSFAARVFAAGLAAEAERLGQQDLAERIRELYP